VGGNGFQFVWGELLREDALIEESSARRGIFFESAGMGFACMAGVGFAAGYQHYESGMARPEDGLGNGGQTTDD
jgi:hypothetical protein